MTTNPADVKELIPEFFLPNPSFLVNKHNLALGTELEWQIWGGKFGVANSGGKFGVANLGWQARL